jgi:T5orf172 domain
MTSAERLATLRGIADAEPPAFASLPRGCFWRVEDATRPCAKRASTYYGHELAFCHIHDKKFMLDIFREIREAPEFRDTLISLIAQYDREEAQAWTEHRREIRQWPATYGRAHSVYFAERDGFVKIGRTSHLGKRMHDIGKGSCMPQGMSVGPVRLLAAIHCDCTVKGCIRERHFHEKFRDTWLEGEWFLLDPEMASFIGGLEDCLDNRLREVSAPRAAEALGVDPAQARAPLSNDGPEAA